MNLSASVSALRAHAASRATHSLAWRQQQLKQLQRYLREQRSALLQALAADLGKSVGEASLTEIDFLLSDIRHTLKQLPRWLRAKPVCSPLLTKPARSFIYPQPLGTVLIFGAWNYPLQLCLAPLVAAIAAGNCVLLKPSEQAPATAQLLADSLPDYVDKQALTVINGAADTAKALLQERFDHIFYTGGAEVAKQVMAAASRHLTPVTLELGGKSPAIVLADSDIQRAAQRIAWGKWLNAGQTCIAPDYVLVERQQKATLIQALQAALRQFYGNDPRQAKDYGRIINQRHLQRLQQLLNGAEVVEGGTVDVAERYMAPTIVDDPALTHSLMQEEIFGPILPIIGVDDLAHAIAIVRQREKPLALYAFTSDSQAQQQIQQGSDSGTLVFNDTCLFMLNPSLPFGGVGHSGMGRYHGYFGWQTFSHEKAVMKRRLSWEPKLRFAPYGRIKRWLLKRLS